MIDDNPEMKRKPHSLELQLLNDSKTDLILEEKSKCYIYKLKFRKK